jgi:hypothetical protein
MEALLDVMRPGPEQFRFPVAPSQLKVGHKYQHLFIGGLRHMENLRARRMIAPIYVPELETVTIKSINTQPLVNMYKILIVGYQIDGQDGNNYVMYPFQSEEELDTYNRQSMDMFFRLDPTNRRAQLLSHLPTNHLATGGNRRTSRRLVTRSSKKNSCRKSTRRK